MTVYVVFAFSLYYFMTSKVGRSSGWNSLLRASQLSYIYLATTEGGLLKNTSTLKDKNELSSVPILDTVMSSRSVTMVQPVIFFMSLIARPYTYWHFSI